VSRVRPPSAIRSDPLIQSFRLRYAVAGDDHDWSTAQQKVASRLKADEIPSIVSIKNPQSTKRKADESRENGEKKKSKKDKDKSGKKHKKSKA